MSVLHFQLVSRTLYQVLRETAARYGNAPALRQPQPGRGEYLTYSWREYQRAAEEIAAGLRALGAAKGDTVALNSETRLEFYLADLGVVTAGCVAAAMYPSYPAADLVRTLESSGAKIAFVGEPSMLEPLRAAPVRLWILLTGRAEGALTLEEVREIGREALAHNPGLPAQWLAETQPSDPAVLYLTSGATGEPKMAMVTHDAIVANIDMGPAVLPLRRTNSPSPSCPPRISRSAWWWRSCRFAAARRYPSSRAWRLPPEIRLVRPTFLLAPPRIWERIYSSIRTEVRKRPAMAQKAFYGAVGLALAAANYRRAGKPVPLRIRVPLQIADRVIFRKIRDRFGGRMQVAASGAAPLGQIWPNFLKPSACR